MTHKILAVDDDQNILSALRMLFRAEGFDCVPADSPQSAIHELKKQSFELVLLDLNYSTDTTSGEEGLQLIQEIREFDDSLPIVVMTGWGTIEVAVNTMQNGANDFIQKPWENERLLTIVNNQIKFANSLRVTEKLTRQNQLLKQQVGRSSKVIALSESMREILQLAKQVAQTDASVLLTGENGTGKTMMANYIHQHSSREGQELVSVNMGAVAESLFESEMFGHVKGAFTDAKNNRIGRFELADEGTLFLDEIANTPYSQQAKLLRVLESSQFEKVGSSKTQSVDIRLITATNAELDKAVENDLFRKDLLFRINTIEIEIPSLRDRVEDIIPLAESFLTEVANKYSTPVLSISEEAKQALKTYEWPGNVRELNHVVERAQILCQSSQINVELLGLKLSNAQSESLAIDTPTNSPDLREIEEIEQEIIQSRLEHFDGNASKAAESLGLSRSAFYRRLDKNRTA